MVAQNVKVRLAVSLASQSIMPIEAHINRSKVI